ncbi:MAG: hypothetical protein AB2L24_21920 [Mangrovibacterium sp.]
MFAIGLNRWRYGAGTGAGMMVGFRWQYGQLDDRVEFIDDMPADLTGKAPAASRRAEILNRIRPFQCNHDISNVEWLQDDVRYKISGGASDLTNPLKLQMVSIPRLWTTGYLESGYVYRWISDAYHHDWKEIPAFAYPRYRGNVQNLGGVNKLLSVSGVTPTVSTSLINFNTYAKNTIATGQVVPYYLYEILYWLAVMDTGRFNMQAFYTGITNAGTSYANAANTGLLDTLQTPSGQITHEYTPGSFTYPFRWRFIEQFFGQIWQELSGIYVRWEPGWEKQKVYVADHYSVINTNSNYSQYRLVGEVPKTTDNFVLEFIPGTILCEVLGGSSTSGKCDRFYMSTASTAFTNIAIVGGSSSNGSNAGPGYLYLSYSAAIAGVIVGASIVLPELPEAAAQPPAI